MLLLPFVGPYVHNAALPELNTLSDIPGQTNEICSGTGIAALYAFSVALIPLKEK